jgi:putative mRNA 3-end processing factor
MHIAVKVLGGGGEVGRTSVLVRAGNRREAILLDAGINFDEEDNPIYASTYPPKYVKAMVLSHAHLDHIGTAPLYFISGNPVVYATRPTIQMAKLMLEDFLKLNGPQSLYEYEEVERLLERSVPVSFGDRVTVDETYELEFYSAGHIPGSVIVVVNVDGTRIAFTGDINTIDTVLMSPADLERVGRVDVLVMEATYGNAIHPPRKVSEERLITIIEETIDQGGTVLIPAFSIARGQEIMMILAKRDLNVPVAIDGMIRQITEIFLENHSYIKSPDLLRKAYSEFIIVRGWQDRHRIWRKPCVIIAPAGMLKGGPSLYYLKKVGSNPRNAVVLVSFQAPGSPGRRLLEQGFLPDTNEPLKARLEWLDFSSHADKEGLHKVIGTLKPAKVIVVHSDLDVATTFASEVKNRHEFVEDVIVAENNQEYTIPV